MAEGRVLGTAWKCLWIWDGIICMEKGKDSMDGISSKGKGELELCFLRVGSKYTYWCSSRTFQFLGVYRISWYPSISHSMALKSYSPFHWVTFRGGIFEVQGWWDISLRLKIDDDVELPLWRPRHLKNVPSYLPRYDLPDLTWRCHPIVYSWSAYPSQ